MPDRIYVTYTPTKFPGTFHTAVHYERRDSDGNLVKHTAIEVEPEAKGLADKAIGVIEEAFREGDGLTRFGRMKANVIDLMKADPDKTADPNPPYEMIAEGDDLSRHLKRMQLYAHGVNAAGVAYRGSHKNSNTFASGALRAGELPAATGIGHDPAGPAGELLEFFAPGLNEPLAVRALENRRYLGRRIAGTSQASVFDAGAPAVPFTPANESLSPDRQNLFEGRFGGWNSSTAGTSPRNPNQPVPREQPGRPLGLFTGEPMPQWITPPPIFDFSDRSGAFGSVGGRGGPSPQGDKPASVFETGAPAVPFVPSSEQTPVGGIAKWIADLAGIDPRYPDQLAPPPADDELGGFYNDDPVQPWFMRAR